MPRLRRSNPARPGLTRRRAGRGWVLLDAGGQRVTDPEVLGRVRSLAIPPAWRDVWICPDPYGHIQAVGTDAAGRRQYRYHDVWRQHRDRAKHERVLAVGERLPAMRRRWRRDLARPELDRHRVLAAAARLLDLGLFRVGGEEYAEENSTYGLATLRREHVRVRKGRLVFDYPAKAGLRRQEVVEDPKVAEVVAALRRRRDDPSPELFAYRSSGGWSDLKSAAVNEYLREMSGLDMSAKDFRTWHATVLMAAVLARGAPVPASRAARNRLVRAGYAEVSEALGNTPAVCRASYVDPRVVDLFHGGATITLPRKRSDEAMRSALEREVLDLLRTGPD
ncbi:MAG: DNA topoisomerase IB [Mycobacteriales bacterium]